MLRLVKFRAVYHSLTIRIPTQGTKSIKFKESSLPNRERFRLRPQIKKSSQRLWRTMNWNIGKRPKLREKSWFLRTFKIPTQGTESMLFENKIPIQLIVCPLGL